MVSVVKTDDARCEMIAQQLSWATTEMHQGGVLPVGAAEPALFRFRCDPPLSMAGESQPKSDQSGMLDRQFIEIGGLEP